MALLNVALLGFLVVFPMIVALALVVVRANAPRNAVVWIGAVVIAVASIALAVANIGTAPIRISFASHVLDYVCAAAGVVIAAVIVAYGVKRKNPLAVALALIQAVGSLVFEFGFARGIEVEYGLYLDSLSLLMALIVGIVGSGICVYAIGYMEDFQAHEPEGAPDRRPTFFALMFLFLGAMFLIVFSNSMLWMFVGWEVTTLCSFLLISFTRTDEAIRNSFLQVNINLLGGIAFLIALYASAMQFGTLSLDEFLELGALSPLLAALPVAALAFAGITKAAQMPFHSWLLGAMVAPTPTSALLHSSTMVKAGVFLLVKLAPVLSVCVIPSVMVMLVGGFTFLFCSAMAISQSNAKRVLAYSTVANLGLIAACAGVGTSAAVWAAMLLILFHAVAKSLLFLCVGTAEHHIGSRDIESMDLLFDRMPRLARLMMLGILCMFVAPFGMLVAKWATIVSLAEANQVVLLLVLAFGSAVTFMFWSKWLGKLAGIAGSPENVEGTVHASEWLPLSLMAVLLVAACALVPALSAGIVEPYLAGVYGEAVADVSNDNLAICAVCVAVVVIALFAGIDRPKARRVGVYLSGVSADNDARTFRNSLSQAQAATARNWYLEGMFGEQRLALVGTTFCATVIVLGVAFAAVGLPLGL